MLVFTILGYVYYKYDAQAYNKKNNNNIKINQYTNKQTRQQINT